MYKNKLILSSLLAFFCFLMVIGSVTATDNSTLGDDLAIADNYSSQNQLNFIEETDTLNSDFNENSLEKCSLNQNLTISEDKKGELSTIEDNEYLERTEEANLTVVDNASDETLSMPVNSTADLLSSSVSVSSSQGHTYHKGGYTFKVSAYQYKKIRQAINVGKKQKFLDWGFHFKVKTNKVIKVKILKKAKTKYKKVRYEAFTPYPYRGIKVANLNNYYKNGWKKYSTGYESTYGQKYLGYNYVILKKVYKSYKTVKMRVYADIIYVGSEDYVTGQHAYFPWVSFKAMKSGYKTIYLNGLLLK